MRDKMSNEDPFKVTKNEPLSSHLKFIHLRWAGHVRMPPCTCAIAVLRNQ